MLIKKKGGGGKTLLDQGFRLREAPYTVNQANWIENLIKLESRELEASQIGGKETLRSRAEILVVCAKRKSKTRICIINFRDSCLQTSH